MFNDVGNNSQNYGKGWFDDTKMMMRESSRKKCSRIAGLMAREWRDLTSVCCMKSDVENVLSDADMEIYEEGPKC